MMKGGVGDICQVFKGGIQLFPQLYIRNFLFCLKLEMRVLSCCFEIGLSLNITINLTQYFLDLVL